MRRIAASSPTAIGDFRLYPGCRIQLFCAACAWEKDYDPERVIDRLQKLRTGGWRTPLDEVVKRVGWNCPACGRMRWGMAFGWPDNISEAEVKRLANRYRS